MNKKLNYGGKDGKETFADRLKSAMDSQSLKQIDLVRAAEEQGIKLGKSHISQYVSGKQCRGQRSYGF